MNTHTRARGRMSLMVVALAAIGVIALSAAVLVRPVYAHEDVTICHSTNAEGNPYVVNHPNLSGVDGGDDNGDHLAEHTGAVWAGPDTPKDPGWGDIIPPFYSDGHLTGLPGLNWPAGQAIFNNGCNIPNTPTVATIIVPTGPVAIGTIAHDTAQISGATATAGGTISYTLFSNNNCTGLLADLTPTVNAVANGIAPDSKTFTFNSAGTFYFYAVYSGDVQNTGPVNSGCAAEPYTVNPGELVVLAETGTPAPGTSDTAMGFGGSNPMPTIAFGLILLASLATLAYANVKTVRSRS